ncbi:phage major capsid protein [Rhodospirillaceae bacterium SYSU D60014]|uniref:phage major capsid protein n=1 Tax=Virgifigura deserti TaxID=2268457 RepID=UPI000E661E70
MFLTDTQKLAVRKLCGPRLRKAGIGNPDELLSTVHSLDWNALHDTRKAVIREARNVLDGIGDDAPQDRLAEAEAANDALMILLDGIDGEMDARKELGSREPRKHGGDNRRPIGEDRVINGGADDGEITYALAPEQRFADWQSARGGERHDGLSLGRYLRAMVVGAKDDVEKRALSEGTDSAGGYSVPDVLSSRLIDLMRAASVAIRAGARTVPLTSDVNHIAKVLTDPVPGWRAEAGAVAESDPTFTRVTFNPRSLAVLVKASRELLADSLNMEQMLPRIIASAMAVELDRVALFGSGTGSEPGGVTTFTGIQTVAHSAALTSYAPLLQARTKLMTANMPGVTAYVMHPEDEGTLAGLTATDNQPLMVPPAIRDVPILTSTSVDADFASSSPPPDTEILAGWWPSLMIGMRQEIRIEVLRERYADTLQYGFLAHLRADVAAEHENAFVQITGVTH